MDLAHAATTDSVQQLVPAKSRLRRGHQLFAATVSVASLILLTPVASAQQPQRVLLVRAGEGVRLDWAEELATALRTRWSARGQRVDPPPAVSPAARLAVRDALDTAWDAYHSLRIERTRTGLLDLVDRLERVWGRGATSAELVEAWLLLALADGALERLEASRAAIERALAIDPQLEVDPARYPPTLVAEVDRLRGRALQTARLVISVAPARATLVVDGRALPDGAGTVHLPVGAHWVRADAPTRLSAGATVVLPVGGPELTLTLPIDPARALVDIGDIGAPLPASAREALSFLGTTAALLEVERRDGEVELVLRDTATGRDAALRLPAGQAIARIDELLTRLSDGPGEALVWPWVLAAALAVAAAGTVAGVVVASEQPGWTAAGRR